MISVLSGWLCLEKIWLKNGGMLTQRAFVTNKMTLGRTWELITGTISKCTANWMSCIRIYKITLSQFFLDLPELDKPELLPKEHFGDLSAESCWEKDIRAAWKMANGCILALIIIVYVKCWQTEGMKGNNLHRYPVDEPHFCCLYLQRGFSMKLG